MVGWSLRTRGYTRAPAPTPPVCRSLRTALMALMATPRSIRSRTVGATRDRALGRGRERDPAPSPAAVAQSAVRRRTRRASELQQMGPGAPRGAMMRADVCLFACPGGTGPSMLNGYQLRTRLHRTSVNAQWAREVNHGPATSLRAARDKVPSSALLHSFAVCETGPPCPRPGSAMGEGPRPLPCAR